MPSDATITRLADELLLARHTIIELAPDQFHEILKGWRYKIERRRDLQQWRNDLCDAVIKAAEPETNEWESRAACPLCRDSGSGAYGMDGWKLPGGLKMHLEGDRTNKCPVVDAAWKLMLDNHREKFKATELAEAQQLALRKQVDPVVLIDPNRAPELLLGSPWYSGAARKSETIAGLEVRLREIGFEIEHNGNMVAYRFMHGDKWMVLADPRRDGRVDFEVFKRSGKRQWKGLRSLGFHLLEKFKKWPEKFQEHLKAATEN